MEKILFILLVGTGKLISPNSTSSNSSKVLVQINLQMFRLKSFFLLIILNGNADASLGGINYCYFVLETYRVIIQSSLFFSNNIGGLPEQRHDAGYKKSKC